MATVMTPRSRPSNDYGRDWALNHRFAPDDGCDDPLGCDARPSWRGRVHMLGLFLAIPALALLIVFADGARARVGVSIYAAGVCAMFLASTTYHRWVDDLRARAAWRRADHAMVFAAIAGSTTPVVLIVMPSAWGIGLLVVVWTVSVVGAVFKFGPWSHGNSVGSALYAAVSAAGRAGPARTVDQGRRGTRHPLPRLRRAVHRRCAVVCQDQAAVAAGGLLLPRGVARRHRRRRCGALCRGLGDRRLSRRRRLRRAEVLPDGTTLVPSDNTSVVPLWSTASRLDDGDHVGSDQSVDVGGPEPIAYRGCRDAGDLFQAAGIARLDLVAQRRALAEADRRMSARCGPAACLERIDRRASREPG